MISATQKTIKIGEKYYIVLGACIDEKEHFFCTNLKMQRTGNTDVL